MKGNIDDYDANWITVEFSYSDNNLTFTQKVSCLLNYEFESLIDSIDSIILGQETGIIGTFIEPYLSLAITKVKGAYAIQIRFLYDTTDGYWKEVYICEEFDDGNLINLNEEFKVLYKKFPYRPVDSEI